MSDRLEDLDSKLDLVLERYKDYVLGSQGVYFSGSNLALDKKETKQALQSYIDSKVIEAYKKGYIDSGLDRLSPKQTPVATKSALNHRNET